MPSSYGQPRQQILDAIDSIRAQAPGEVARIRISNMQHLCDQHGHVASSHLPGAVVSEISSAPHCQYAALYERGHLTMGAEIVAIFSSRADAEKSLDAVSATPLFLLGGVIDDVILEVSFAD